jgi:hypothetical protein
MASVTLFPHGDGRYLRTPELRLVDGSPALFVLSWEGEAERLRRLPVGGGEGAVLAEAGPLVGLSRDEGVPEPIDALEPAPTRRGWRARVERDGAVSTVLLETPRGRRVPAFRGDCTAAAPDVAPTEDGCWVAFHHDLREDTGVRDLAKWITLRFVDREGRVFEPRAPMTDRDRDREGEEQSFEFPRLALGPDGALAIFGRGSHAFWRQDLSASGFSPRAALDAGGWGCRGRWVSPLVDGDRLLTARRERKGIVLEELPLPSGGPPALAPVDVAEVAPTVSVRHTPATFDGRMVLFGDIHQHSAHSDGIGSADEPYLRARHVYGDDFVALTDHESFLGKRIGPGEWAGLCAVADAHDDPGAFATLLAYEWTGRRHPGPGHKVVYLPEGGGPVLSRDVLEDGASLLAAAKAIGAFAVPHHVGWTGADEAAHDEAAQPVWEICSCHGCYLTADHPLGGRGDLRDQMVEEVLRRGGRFGFIACSDGHGLLWHHGVGRKRDPFRCGLTAVQATARTRGAILDALRARRCYATSGAKIVLDLRVGDEAAPMGSFLEGRAARALQARARGTAPLSAITLQGPDGVLAEGRIQGAEGHLEAPVADVPWAYLRVAQEDGERAWSSPVFFR